MHCLSGTHEEENQNIAILNMFKEFQRNNRKYFWISIRGRGNIGREWLRSWCVYSYSDEKSSAMADEIDNRTFFIATI